ncbi:NADH dehydrogenase [ubiquinone] 1 alpha subcomplex assembly factor 5 [Desmophyllum pertusum]|uniref:NADH dehydrogenase [ubiquinone] 1 alpha subcomplex assembly factor 5 n=1 Tax=Desmophyllum pertusum TaxID=174260 RepID=A0A9W9Z0M9_9CNID|nr:NADH dehydrogenase [ubiquinone] 1 alpha subcomplex assembly factor 5 [Desmophyllum pertusum]
MACRRLVSVLGGQVFGDVLVQERQDEAIMNVFDRKAKRRQKNRAALAEDVAVYDYLRDEVAERMVDRIGDIARHFPMALDLGCGRGHISKYLTKEQVGTLVMSDMAENMLFNSFILIIYNVMLPRHNASLVSFQPIKVVADEEFLPFPQNNFDLVVSSLSLHWVNDLPGTFRQINHCLKDDGVFIGAMFGGETLYQLRAALQLAETEREGGFAAHISPCGSKRSWKIFLTRSGFTLTTVVKWDKCGSTSHFSLL